MTSFCPKVWPEDSPPPGVVDCKECGLYEHGSRVVWGEGNPDANIIVLLDNPGLRKDKKGRSFVCGTRQTLQTAADEAGLGKDDLYVTYVLKRRPTRAYNKEKAREECLIHLDRQLKANSPRFIFCLGNVALQCFLKDQDAQVKTMRGMWHQVKGFEVLTSYHPLAVRRRPNLKRLFSEDVQMLAQRYKEIL